MKTFFDWLALEDVQQVDGETIHRLQLYLMGKLDARSLESSVYDSLTKNFQNRNAFVAQTKNPNSNWRETANKFHQLKDGVDNALKALNWISKEPEPGWIEWFRNGKTGVGLQKIDGKTFKRYVTVDTPHMWDAIRSLTILARGLGQIQVSNPNLDMIGFKIPATYGGFVEHRDSIVIHYYDPSIKAQVDQAVNNFVAKTGIKTQDRASFGRSDNGVDISGAKGGSDSQMFSRQIVRNIDANRNMLLPLVNDIPRLTATYERIKAAVSNQVSHR